MIFVYLDIQKFEIFQLILTMIFLFNGLVIIIIVKKITKSLILYFKSYLKYNINTIFY